MKIQTCSKELAVLRHQNVHVRGEKRGNEGEATGRNCGDDESGVSSHRVKRAPLDGELKPHT